MKGSKGVQTRDIKSSTGSLRCKKKPGEHAVSAKKVRSKLGRQSCARETRLMRCQAAYQQRNFNLEIKTKRFSLEWKLSRIVLKEMQSYTQRVILKHRLNAQSKARAATGFGYRHSLRNAQLTRYIRCNVNKSGIGQPVCERSPTTVELPDKHLDIRKRDQECSCLFTKTSTKTGYYWRGQVLSDVQSNSRSRDVAMLARSYLQLIIACFFCHFERGTRQMHAG